MPATSTHRRLLAAGRTGLVVQALLCAGHVLVGAAWAANVEPKAFEPRYDQEIREKPAKPIVVPVSPSVSAPEGARPRESATFTLSAVTLTGNTVFSDTELRADFESLLGTPVSTHELLSITEAMTARYRAAGYFLSRAFVPAQDIVNGRVEIRLAEGSIETVEIQTDKTAIGILAPFSEAIKAERPLRLATLERQVMLISQLGGFTIQKTTIDEVGEFSGSFKLSLEISFDRFDGYATVDTYGTRNVGRLQGQANLAVNAPITGRGRLNATLGGVPNDPREWVYAAIGYDLMAVPGLWLGARADYGALHPDGEDRLISAREDYWDASVNIGYVHYLTREFSLRFDGRLSAGDSTGDDVNGPDKRDRIRSVGLSTTLYTALPGRGGLTAYADIEQGLNLLGASDTGDPFLSRADARADFTRLSGGLTLTQPLFGPVSIAASGAAQISSAPLLSSREFYLGGARFGRGYEPGTLSGDIGIAGSAELRIGHDTTLGWLRGWQLYGFYDGGAVWEKGANSTRVSLASAGGGLRLYFAQDLQLALEVGVPLTYEEVPGRREDPRVNLFVAKSF